MKYLIAVLVILVISGALVIDSLIAYKTRSTVHFTVNDKAVVVGSKSSKYLIYTTAGVYEDQDSVWYWKWNSSDVYNQLERGNSYTAIVYGFRVPFLSLYKNIVSVN